MTEMRIKLGIKIRSCGLQSPPPPDHHFQPSSKRTACRGVGKFGIPSLSWINSIIKAKQMSKPRKCHRGVGVLSASAYGNMASDWSCLPQSPPQVFKIERGMRYAV
jgi:hypothetical protein